jgi:hypothetical protein
VVAALHRYLSNAWQRSAVMACPIAKKAMGLTPAVPAL